MSFSKTREAGYIDMLIGPMFSGKSTALIEKVQRFQIAKLKCLVFKWCSDIRYEENKDDFSTHGKIKLPCQRVSNKLMDHAEKLKGFDVIGLDDGQFFPDIEEFCEYAVNDLNMIVIISALDADFRRNPFKNITNLIPKAEKVKKLCAVCMNCGRNAAFTAKIVESKNGEVIDVGGSDKYTVLCRQCYMRKDKD